MIIFGQLQQALKLCQFIVNLILFYWALCCCFNGLLSFQFVDFWAYINIVFGWIGIIICRSRSRLLVFCADVVASDIEVGSSLTWSCWSVVLGLLPVGDSLFRANVGWGLALIVERSWILSRSALRCLTLLSHLIVVARVEGLPVFAWVIAGIPCTVRRISRATTTTRPIQRVPLPSLIAIQPFIFAIEPLLSLLASLLYLRQSLPVSFQEVGLTGRNLDSLRSSLQIHLAAEVGYASGGPCAGRCAIVPGARIWWLALNTEPWCSGRYSILGSLIISHTWRYSIGSRVGTHKIVSQVWRLVICWQFATSWRRLPLIASRSFIGSPYPISDGSHVAGGGSRASRILICTQSCPSNAAALTIVARCSRILRSTVRTSSAIIRPKSIASGAKSVGWRIVVVVPPCSTAAKSISIGTGTSTPLCILNFSNCLLKLQLQLIQPCLLLVFVFLSLLELLLDWFDFFALLIHDFLIALPLIIDPVFQVMQLPLQSLLLRVLNSQIILLIIDLIPQPLQLNLLVFYFID